MEYKWKEEEKKPEIKKEEISKVEPPKIKKKGIFDRRDEKEAKK